MSLTWRDGVTTLATAGAVVLERAYFHNWDWPLLSSMRWAIAGLAILIAVNYLFGFILDATRGEGWTVVANALAVIAVLLTAFGLSYVVSDYVVLLMVTAIVFWAASIVRRLAVHVPMAHGHA